MTDPRVIVEAFRMLQAGDAAGALRAASNILATDPSSARSHLVAGLALRALHRLDESRSALERAQALDPRDYAAAFELGVALELQGDSIAALTHFERATALRPEFLPAQMAALRLAGRSCVARGEFAQAARYFATAAARDPRDEALPIFLFQVELLLENWKEGWAAYRRRETRRQLEASLQASGRPTDLPTAAQVEGVEVTIADEQGLGDTLFFLRFAPQLRDASRLAFAGDARLHPLLARTGIFDSMSVGMPLLPEAPSAVLLAGDLPEACAQGGDPCPTPLRIPPDPQRLAAWREKLQALGPRPWIGVTWRAGTPGEVLALGLYKTVPVSALMAAVAPLGGTVVALQRELKAGEIEAASAALGRPVHDLSAVNDDLEDALAAIALLDRHVGVSSTNMHLAAAAGRTADVLVPFPPEWRWGLGEESLWFPGFRVHRQSREGDWSAALAGVASEAAGNASRG